MAIVHGGRIAAEGTLAELRRERAEAGTLEDIFFAVTGGSAAAGGPAASRTGETGSGGPA
jgi:hypothetical protein